MRVRSVSREEVWASAMNHAYVRYELYAEVAHEKEWPALRYERSPSRSWQAGVWKIVELVDATQRYEIRSAAFDALLLITCALTPSTAQAGP